MAGKEGILPRMARLELSEGGEGVSHTDIRGEDIPGERIS